MPELPEVEAFRFYVNQFCLHKKIISLYCKSKQLIKKPSFSIFSKKLINQKFETATRQGKYLILPLKNSTEQLVLHFGLTGSPIFVQNQEQTVPFSQLAITFEDGSTLHIIDKRKFGKIWLVKNSNEIKAVAQLGPDPLGIPQKDFIHLVQTYPRQNIKAFFMDQKKISGIGNEYSDEILFQSGIDPHHKVKDLSEKEIINMYKKMLSILKYAINLRKKNMSQVSHDYFFSDNDNKNFKKSYLQNHRHTDQKCPKNSHHTLKRATIAGRTTYYCPQDQK